MKNNVQEMETFYSNTFKPEYFCHYDLHRKNMMKNETNIFIIDFDHADYGYRKVSSIIILELIHMEYTYVKFII